VGVFLGWRPERFSDGSQHAVAIRENVIVPEPKKAPALPLQIPVALLVIAWPRMLPAIGFHDQLFLNTGEIDDVRWYRELASKAETKSPMSQLSPKRALSVG
jgi:hypothetical protein